MGLRIGMENVGGLRIGRENVGGLKIGREWIYRAVQPISIFDSSVAWGGRTAGAVWSYIRNSTNTAGYIVSAPRSIQAPQQIPTAYIQSAATAYVTTLFLSTSGSGRIDFQLEATASSQVSQSGPQFTEAAEDILGLAIRAANGTTLKWRISDLDALDETEPYSWFNVNPGINAAFVAAINASGAQAVLVDISNANVDWDNLTFKQVSGLLHLQ